MASRCGDCIFKTISGKIWDGDRFDDGTVTVENGIVKEVSFGSGRSSETYILPGIADCHTHVADSGLKLERKYGLRELVAPPAGLKHRYLSETDDDALLENMKGYSERLVSNGVSRFVDFREGGVRGCKLLRKASDRALILGRPVSPKYDGGEIDEILETADGIGISGIADMDRAYIEKIADAVHRKNKMLALHVSETEREDAEYALSLNPDFVVHMTKAEKSDVALCADAGVPIVVCASSNLYFGNVPNIRMMADCGAETAIGTDNGMLSPSADILAEFRTFWKILSEQGGNPSDAYASLITHGGKIIKQNTTIQEQTDRRADLLILSADPLRGGCCIARYGP